MIEPKLAQSKLVIPRWRHWRVDLRGDIAKDSAFINAKKNLDGIDELRSLVRQEFQDGLTSDRASARLACEAMLVGEPGIAVDIAGKINSSKSILEPTRHFIGSLLKGHEPIILAQSRNDFIVELGLLKVQLDRYPRHAILWVERARLYTILGQREKAIGAAKVALHLAPHNRYVVRSATRLFMHFDEWDSAWHYALRGYKWNPDPWLKSLVVSVGTRAEVQKRLPNFNSQINEANTQSGLFSLSELNAATGMLELESGNETKAKKIFRYAWKNPASTVVSHGVWVINNKLRGLSDSVNFDLSSNIQGAAYNLLNQRRYADLIPVLNEWLLEEPYSSEPHNHLYTAYINLRRFDDAVRIAKKGYESNVGEKGFLNQIAYALLRKDNHEGWIEAGRVIEEMDKCPDFKESPVPNATKGMHLILTGKIDEGVLLYKKSIEAFAKSQKVDSQLVCGANLLMNIIRAYKGVPITAYESYIKRMEKSGANYVKDGLNMLKYEAEKYIERPLDEKNVKPYIDVGSSLDSKE